MGDENRGSAVQLAGDNPRYESPSPLDSGLRRNDEVGGRNDEVASGLSKARRNLFTLTSILSHQGRGGKPLGGCGDHGVFSYRRRLGWGQGPALHNSASDTTIESLRSYGAELGQVSSFGFEHLLDHAANLVESQDGRGHRIERDGLLDRAPVALDRAFCG